MECYTCRDKGMVGGCPDCGKVFSLGKKGSVKVSAEMLDKALIPKEYLSVLWDREILESQHPQKLSEESFKHYVDQLTKLYGIFASGRIPDQSAIIIAERGMGKMTLAYVCMRLALENGYSVCPLLDNTQIKRINELSADKPNNYYLYQMPKIEEIIGSDVLFMTVDKDRYSTALRTIESIIDKRARRSLSTFVITRFSLETMSQFEAKNSYFTLQDFTRSFNNKKYPIIIKG